MTLLNILINLIGGLFSGLLSTRFFWWYNNQHLSPKIDVSTEIGFNNVLEPIEVVNNVGEKTICNRSITQYKIKILNQSKRAAYDIKSYIRIRYNGVYATIALPYLPVLHGKTDENSFDNERDLPFYMTEFQLPKIIRFDNQHLLNKYKAGNLLLEDFDDKDTLLEIILFATDSKSGASQRLTTIKRSYSEIIKCLKPGDFIPGKLIIGKGNQEARN